MDGIDEMMRMEEERGLTGAFFEDHVGGAKMHLFWLLLKCEDPNFPCHQESRSAML